MNPGKMNPGELDAGELDAGEMKAGRHAKPQMVIAVDGPAASGKGTLARRLALHYGLPHLDTGLLYRAVGQRLRIEQRSLSDIEAAISIAESFVPAWLQHPELRSREAGIAATAVAVIPQVRLALRDFQRSFARQPAGAVLDGRDIGTMIAPDAKAKLWVTAAPEIRAERRFRELLERGSPVERAEILKDLMARDANDAPNMIRAADATVIDTSQMTIGDAFETALRAVDTAFAAGPKR
jgi:cytidylate kinase